MTSAELLKFEPIVYKIFLSALESKKIANAYLLSGTGASPLKETALYLAKSLNCESGSFACDTCPSCLRFEAHNSTGFTLIDGQDRMIKKGEILDLIESSSFTSSETNHLQIYIIHLVENMNDEAINSLLKLLEEPPTNLCAILTTSNIERVLKTIISRSVTLPLNPLPIKEILSKFDDTYDSLDIFLASHFSSSKETILTYLEDAAYQEAKNEALDYLKALEVSPEAGFFQFINTTSLRFKDKKCYNYYYQFLEILFKESSLEVEDWEDSLKSLLKPLKDYSKDSILSARDALIKAYFYKHLNLNPALFMAELTHILEGGK